MKPFKSPKPLSGLVRAPLLLLGCASMLQAAPLCGPCTERTFPAQAGNCDVQKVVPDNPGLLETIDLIKTEDPGIIWDLFPQSYQNAMNQLVRDFFRQVDPEVFRQAHGSFVKVVRILDEKRDIIISLVESETGNHLDQELPEQFVEIYDAVVALMKDDIDSAENDLVKLRNIDLGKAMADHHAKWQPYEKMLEKMVADLGLADLGEDAEVFGGLAGLLAAQNEMVIEVVDEDGDSGVIRLGLGGELIELECVRIDGRWVPEKVVDLFDPMMEMAHEAIGKIDWQQARMIGLPVFVIIHKTLDDLLAADSAEQFVGVLSKVGTMMGLE